MFVLWVSSCYSLTVRLIYDLISSLLCTRQRKYFSHIFQPGSDSLLGHVLDALSWYWQTLWSLNRFDRLIVFQRITPTPNNAALALVFVCFTFTLTLSSSERAKPDDFNAVSVPSSPQPCPTRCVTVSVSPSYHSFRISYGFDFLGLDYSCIYSIVHQLGVALWVCQFPLMLFVFDLLLNKEGFNW